MWLDKKDLPGADLYENYVSYDCFLDGTAISGGTVLFTAPKQFHFRNPHLQVRHKDGYIIVIADAYARCVEILNEDDTLLLSDNYFDMNAGETRVKILHGKAEGLKVRSVYDIR